MQNGIEISFAILVPGNRISYLLIRNWQLKFFLSSFFIIFDRLYDRRQAFIHSRDLILTCNTYMRSMTQATSYASCTASTFQSEGKDTMSTHICHSIIRGRRYHGNVMVAEPQKYPSYVTSYCVRTYPTPASMPSDAINAINIATRVII